MAESKKRKKNGHEVEDDTDIQNWTDGIPLSPAWWAPTFVALMILGLLWVVVYYISSARTRFRSWARGILRWVWAR